MGAASIPMNGVAVPRPAINPWVIAVAVTLENIRGPQSQGGIVAAPIAKAVLQELLK